MYQTTYHRPSSVDEAVAAFAKGSDSKYLAGGHTLIPVMKQRLASPSDVIDLGKIKELIGIEAIRRRADDQGGDDLFRHHAKRRREKVDSRDRLPHLAARRSRRAASRHDRRLDRQQRSGGGLSGGVLALGATVKTNKRSISADDFFKGLFTTALEDGEIITAVSFPVPAKAGYAKFRHPASRFALTGVFVTKTKAGDVRVAATGASQNGVMRVSAIEAALKANWSAGAIDSVKISADGLMSDIHGTSDYRANLIKVMAQRAVTAAG